ncbi:MAG TPA: right-handed parallel beta-helix repeat-containing protein [Burkholderiales bacterium]|nr:right-handed parallel beta-helix repeat-containing protein [Burkholderiales bacterium]
MNRMFWSAGLLACVVVFPAHAAPDQRLVDCDRGQSIQGALARADSGDTIIIKGTCAGGINIRKNRLTLKGVNGAVVDGQGKDAISIIGAVEVALVDLEIKSGRNGIVATAGAQFSLKNANVHDHATTGVSMRDNTSATLAESQTSHNGVNGVSVENSSSLTITGNFTAEANGVFGIVGPH